MSLDAYLERIAYTGPTTPTLETLVGVHRAHMEAVPYENLAIHLGGENTLVEADFLQKIVTQHRGGWCYEMNGILSWALREMGFNITRASAAAARAFIGDDANDNHLIAFADLDRRWVVDVGLGDGPSEPFPLEEGRWSEGPLEFRLERLDDTWWRFHNHQAGLAPSFDFTEAPRELPSFQTMCTMLQTEDYSIFRIFAMVIRRTPRGFRAIRDITWIEATDNEKNEHEIASVEEYRERLTGLIGHSLGADADVLWRDASARARKRADDAASAATETD